MIFPDLYLAHQKQKIYSWSSCCGLSCSLKFLNSILECWFQPWLLCFLSGFLLLCPRRQQWMAQCSCPCHPHRKPEWSSWFLASAWPALWSWGHLGEGTDAWLISSSCLSLSAFFFLIWKAEWHRYIHKYLLKYIGLIWHDIWNTVAISIPYPHQIFTVCLNKPKVEVPSDLIPRLPICGLPCLYLPFSSFLEPPPSLCGVCADHRTLVPLNEVRLIFGMGFALFSGWTVISSCKPLPWSNWQHWSKVEVEYFRLLRLWRWHQIP